MPRDGTKNLKPQNTRTKDEQKKIAKKGGKKSGEARRAKKTARQAALDVLNGKPSYEVIEKLSMAGLATDANVMSAILAGQALTAMKGNAQSAKLLLELSGADKEEASEDSESKYKGLPAEILGGAFQIPYLHILSRQYSDFDFEGGRGSLKSSSCALFIIDQLERNQRFCGLAVRQLNTGEDAVPSLQIAKRACTLVANNVAVGLESEAQDDDDFNADFQKAVKKVRDSVEAACATSQIIWRPDIDVESGSGSVIAVTSEAGTYLPTRFNRLGEMTAVVFVEQQKVGDDYFTLLTRCDYADGTYTIENKAYRGELSKRGGEIPLTAVESWKDLSPLEVHRASRPWFVELTAPNNEAVFRAALDQIKEADIQDSRSLGQKSGYLDFELIFCKTRQIFEGISGYFKKI